MHLPLYNKNVTVWAETYLISIIKVNSRQEINVYMMIENLGKKFLPGEKYCDKNCCIPSERVSESVCVCQSPVLPREAGSWWYSPPQIGFMET